MDDEVAPGLRRVNGRAPSTAELELWRRAREVAAQAYARYSGLHVGAALRSPEGAVYLGVNVENASYPAGLCAERAALAAAVTAGERSFAALAVATEQNDPLLPCGACLQALGEFGELDIVVVLPDQATDRAEPRVIALSELLRAPFRSPRDLP